MNAEETRDISSKSEDWGVLDIKRKYDKGDLNVPDFQRRPDVWKPPSVMIF